jgi:hypothetical protein
MAYDDGSSLGKTNDDFIEFDYSDKHKTKDKYKSKREIKQILKDKTKSSIRPNIEQNLGPDADEGSPDTGIWDEHQGYEESIGGGGGGGINAYNAAGSGMKSVFENIGSTAAGEAISEGSAAVAQNLLDQVVTPEDIDPRGPKGHGEDDLYSTSEK